jgi:hypothetical protein
MPLMNQQAALVDISVSGSRLYGRSPARPRVLSLCHRRRLREEWGEVEAALVEKVKGRVCKKRCYESEEFEAALIATRHRPRLPYGWTALDLAVRRLKTRPIRLLNEDLEASRYAKGVLSLAMHLQEIQGEEPILLPVEQLREILSAKKVVVAGTITKLVEMGLLELTKASYNTGSAREFRFRGLKGQDYVFEPKADETSGSA